MSHEQCVEAVTVALSTTYVLYLKTQNFHWNVRGPHFFSYHEAFETQYTALASAVDELAEQLRNLGVASPGSFEEFEKHAGIQSCEGAFRPARTMVSMLAEDHAWLIAYLEKQVLLLMESGHEAVADMLNSRVQAHQSMHWMLSSAAENDA